MLIVCDPKATSYKYLAQITIKAMAATIRSPKAQYVIRTGAGVFVVAHLGFQAGQSVGG
jgi:hypothetical protein